MRQEFALHLSRCSESRNASLIRNFDFNFSITILHRIRGRTRIKKFSHPIRGIHISYKEYVEPKSSHRIAFLE